MSIFLVPKGVPIILQYELTHSTNIEHPPLTRSLLQSTIEISEQNDFNIHKSCILMKRVREFDYYYCYEKKSDGEVKE